MCFLFAIKCVDYLQINRAFAQRQQVRAPFLTISGSNSMIVNFQAYWSRGSINKPKGAIRKGSFIPQGGVVYRQKKAFFLAVHNTPLYHTRQFNECQVSKTGCEHCSMGKWRLRTWTGVATKSLSDDNFSSKRRTSSKHTNSMKNGTDKRKRKYSL